MPRRSFFAAAGDCRSCVISRLVVAAVVGLILLIGGGRELALNLWLVSAGDKVQADVIREGDQRYFRYSRDRGGETLYYFIPTEKIRRAWVYDVGDRIDVYVIPESTEHGAHADLLQLIVGPLIVTLLGVAGSWLGLSGLLSLRRKGLKTKNKNST